MPGRRKAASSPSCNSFAPQPRSAKVCSEKAMCLLGRQTSGAPPMRLDPQLHRFRLASRDLFNQYYFPGPPNSIDIWDALELFAPVEEVLFQTLVIQKSPLSPTSYGAPNSEILVVVRSDSTPIMVNRERGKDHGYWDFPIERVDRKIVMNFVCFFDFDKTRHQDHQYVHVEIADWASDPEVVGRRALIENQYVSFELASNVGE